MKAKKITKAQANKAATVIKNYAKQQAKSQLKKGAKITVKKTKSVAKKAFVGLSKFFK